MLTLVNSGTVVRVTRDTARARSSDPASLVLRAGGASLQLQGSRRDVGSASKICALREGGWRLRGSAFFLSL